MSKLTELEISFLKGPKVHFDKCTTTSPSYAIKGPQVQQQTALVNIGIYP